VWGALNGIYLIAALIWKRGIFSKITFNSIFPQLIADIFNMLATFLLVCYSWIFFRANNISDALYISKKIFTDHGKLFYNNPNFLFSLAAIGMLLIAEAKKEYFDTKISFFGNQSIVVRYATYTLLVLLILLMGVFDGSQFIYFQF
jgi:hypothetical protein